MKLNKKTESNQTTTELELNLLDIILIFVGIGTLISLIYRYGNI